MVKAGNIYMVLYGNCARLNHLPPPRKGTVIGINPLELVVKLHQQFTLFPCLDYVILYFLVSG